MPPTSNPSYHTEQNVLLPKPMSKGRWDDHDCLIETQIYGREGRLSKQNQDSVYKDEKENSCW